MTRIFLEHILRYDEKVVLDKDNSHYISSVLRMREGEEVMLVGSDGKEAVSEVETITKNEVTLHITSVRDNESEPRLNITLYQSVSKGERMDLTIQKSVELGVSTIVPVWSSRCVVKKDAVIGNSSKNDRWQKIALEAARQSGRGKVPEVTDGMKFEQALKKAASECDLVLFPWEEAKGLTLKGALSDKTLNNIGIFIGPEGGFSEEEAEIAKENGAVPVTLGKRILRTETAGPAVLSMLLFHDEL